jgi:hypothetical protein
MFGRLLNLLRFITSHPLNKDNKLRATVRFARWQISSRLTGARVVYEWINSSKFYVSHGETGLTQNIYTGLHEFADMAFLLHLLRSTDLFIDGSQRGLVHDTCLCGYWGEGICI